MNNKLVKVSDRKQIFGVCEGLARYFDVDSTIVRVVFAVSTIFGVGSPIIIYLALALIMPNDYDVDHW